LFVDMVDSTVLANELDSESFRALIELSSPEVTPVRRTPHWVSSLHEDFLVVRGTEVVQPAVAASGLEECYGVPAQRRFLTSTNPRRSVAVAPARLSSGDPYL
jgi:hypothetical protein